MLIKRLNQASSSQNILFLLLVGFLWSLCSSPVHAGGLSWGDFGGGSSATTEASCKPDQPLVITPGPLGSPVRIIRIDSQTSLVADYIRKTIYKVDQDGMASPFIKTEGRPLSIAAEQEVQKVDTQGKAKKSPQGKSFYYVGNEDSLSVDVYRIKNDNAKLVKRHFVGEHGIQALDMALVEELGQLFVVDGISRSIKVLLRDGQLLRSFGGDNVLSSPKGIAVDVSTGEVFVSDYGDSKVGIPASIKVFDLAGGVRKTITGSFSRPQGMALANGKLFVADNMLAQILEFDRSTNLVTKSYACQGSSEGHLLLPMDVVVDAEGLNLYVADNRNMRITVLPLNDGQ